MSRLHSYKHLFFAVVYFLKTNGVKLITFLPAKIKKSISLQYFLFHIVLSKLQS